MTASAGNPGTRADPTGDDPVFWEPSQAFLKIAIACVLVGAMIFAIALTLFYRDPVRALVDLLLVVVSGAAWFLLARGRIRAAARTLIFGVWTFAVLMSFFLGGVESILVILFPLLILLAGWMAGTRTGVVLALLTTVATLGFALLESQGRLPVPFQSTAAMRWIIQTYTFIFSALLIVKLVDSYRGRLQEVRALGADLVRRTEEALASEARFRSMFENNASVLMLIDPESGAIVDASAAAARFYGYALDHLRTMNIDQINTLPAAEIAAERQRAARQERNEFIFSHRLASGDVRTVEARATPIDVDGKKRLFSIISDVTERKRAEDALAQQTRDLAARNDELTRFSQVAVDRELRMIELKREVNALCAQLGEPPKYGSPDNPDRSAST